jgi:PAS domain S-box-containing protein
MRHDVCVIHDMLTSSFTSQPIFGNEWNVKTSEITGFSHDEAFNKPLVDTFIVPSLRKSVHDVMENALKGIETSNYELEFRTKSNEIRYLLVNATSRRDAENNIVGVVGVAQDVTEAAQHDRAVAAMANELRTLIDTANAVSYLIYDICVIRV